jgi:TonB-dependent starch-binding outer membrane protein SusC
MHHCGTLKGMFVVGGALLAATAPTPANGAQDTPGGAPATQLAILASSPTPSFFERSGSRRTTVNGAAVPGFQRRVSLSLVDVPIADAIGRISEEAGLDFTYSSEIFPEGASVSLRAEDITVVAALTDVLLNTQVDVEVTRDGHVNFVKRAAAAKRQQGRITGRVIDADTHLGIPEAPVTVTGTTIGVTTSDSGTFALPVPPDAKTLSVRRIGYLAQVVALETGKSHYEIALKHDVLRLQAEVVTGVATTVASQNAANAVSVVNTQDINEVPAPTVENAIQGRIPGAVIETNNSGAPGGGLQIQVRGITSINGNALPLYVIDGVVVNNETINAGDNAIDRGGGGLTSTGQGAATAPSGQDNSPNRMADINPDDIESIEILKGASASAIYGSKASAGVVIITTKRGTTGKAKWDVSNKLGHFALSNTYAIRNFPTLSSAQAWYVNDVARDTAAAAIAADNSFISSVYAGPQDYQTQLFGNPQVAYQTNVSVSGSSGSASYFLSGLSKYDNGTMYNTGYNKQSVRANITQQAAASLSVSANLNYIHDVTRRGITGNDNIGISPYDVFSYTPGFLALNQLSPDGSWEHNPFGPANPFADAYEIQTPQQLSRFIGGGSINWTPWKTEHQSVQLQMIGGADLSSLQDLLYAPPDLQQEQQQPSGLPGTAVTNGAQINYFNYSINLVHRFTGFSWLDATTSAGFVRERRSLTNPVSVGENLLAGINSPTAGTVQQNYLYKTAQNDQSLYAQEQVLSLDSRLAVTAGITAERSTNDGDINRFYYYPRYSASYRIPQFASVLDELKVRAAYGQSGNLAPYGARYSTLNQTLDGGANGIGGNLELGDANIKPESEQEIETGFDATVLHSRAQLSATIYQKRLTSLLLQAGVAPSYGYATTFINGGEFTNQGLELSLQSTPVQLRNGFTWVNTLTLFRNYSVVNALPVPPFTVENQSGFGNGFLAPGRSVSEIVNPNITGPGGLPVWVGDASPGLLMSLGNEFTWKAFRVYGFLDWSRGGNQINVTDFYYDFGPVLGADSAAGANRVAALNANEEPYVQGASFLKVRQLAVSYTVPARAVNRIGFGRITSARVSLSGYNLWAIYRYHGLDPEVSFAGDQTIRAAGDITPYPPARSYFVGLDLGF